jgi:SAM-dependent methyltransferase
VGIGRRKVRLDEQEGWIFNRMVDAYRARPPYPDALVSAVAHAVGPAAPLPVLDVGAGVGHLALPLAARGVPILALEPAKAMLEALMARAGELPVQALRPLHATAEELPLAPGSVGAAIVADALHFLDAELAGTELARVLAPRGRLVIVAAELAPTPFMNEVVAAMEAAAPRRPRAVDALRAQLAACAGVGLGAPRTFEDHTEVDEARLLAILRSISFIGPAMNAERSARFADAVCAIAGPRVWSRRFTLLVSE